jgi:ADP-ribosyl-[dinitrogen reductase] hydrolase
MNNKRFLHYIGLLRKPFTTGPDWFDFGVCAQMAVENKIKNFKERTIMYRRHYQQDLDSPINVDTFIICPSEWLWHNCWRNCGFGDYERPWAETQLMLHEEFPEYKLSFSESPAHTFKIPGIDTVHNVYILALWVKIETKGLSRKIDPMLLTSARSLYNQMEERVIGTLMGQAVGNALGVRYEFSTASAAEKGVERDTLPNGHLPMLEGGPFQMLPGQITGDTELALMLARRLDGGVSKRPKGFLVREKRSFSEVDLFYVANAFLDWYFSDPFNIGNENKTAFSRINRDIPIEEIHREMLVNARDNMDSLSNSCLAKISPIALIGVLPVDGKVMYIDEELADFAADVCKLTNPNPITQDACRVYIMAIRNAIRGDSRQLILEKALKGAETDLIKQIITDSKEQTTHPLGVALQLAFFELLYGKSFEHSLVRTITRGGDTDTNGCIVGSLLGAFYGYSEIPSDWSKAVLNVKNPRVEQLPEVSTHDLITLALKLGTY